MSTGQLPSGWNIVPVREAGEVRLGRQRSPQHQSGRFTMPYLRVANVFDGYIDYSDVLEMDFRPAERKAYGLLPGDILLNEGQSLELVGRSAIYQGEPGAYCFQNTLVRFRCNETTAPTYCQAVFKYWLDTGRFTRVARQTTSVAHLGADRFADMPFPRPPIEVQRRIAEVLEAIDVVLRDTHSVVSKVSSSKSGALDDLLSCFNDIPGAFALGKWEASSVGLEFDITTGFTLGEHRRPRNNKRRYLRVANVQRGHIDTSDLLELEASDSEMTGMRLEAGDLLVVEGHANPKEIGRCSIADGESIGLTFQNHLFRLRSRRLRPEFCETWLNSRWAQDYWRRRCVTSSGLYTINQTMLRDLVIPVPPPPEQEAVIESLHRYDTRLDKERAYLSKLGLQKSGLMHDLITGRVTV
jgi:type I restriction enzyme, S subunit